MARTDIPSTEVLSEVACGEIITEVEYNKMRAAVNALKSFGAPVFQIHDRAYNGARQPAVGFGYGIASFPTPPASPGEVAWGPATNGYVNISDTFSLFYITYIASGYSRTGGLGPNGWYAYLKTVVTYSNGVSSLVLLTLVSDTPYSTYAPGDVKMPVYPGALQADAYPNVVAMSPALPNMQASTISVQHYLVFNKGPWAGYATGGAPSSINITDRNQWHGLLTMSINFAEPF
jgi:hypothetical protein